MNLIAKNRILIVHFANKLQEQGAAKLAAIREASITRLRPVLMTSVANLPPVFVTGSRLNGPKRDWDGPGHPDDRRNALQALRGAGVPPAHRRRAPEGAGRKERAGGRADREVTGAAWGPA